MWVPSSEATKSLGAADMGNSRRKVRYSETALLHSEVVRSEPEVDSSDPQAVRSSNRQVEDSSCHNNRKSTVTWRRQRCGHRTHVVPWAKHVVGLNSDACRFMVYDSSDTRAQQAIPSSISPPSSPGLAFAFATSVATPPAFPRFVIMHSVPSPSAWRPPFRHPLLP